MNWWNLANSVLAGLALIAAAVAIYYSQQQVKLQKAQAEKEKRRESETVEWAAKCEKAIQLVTTVSPTWQHGGGGFNIAFPDPGLRQRIGAYLVEIDPAYLRVIHQKAVTPDQLQLPGVRQTIQDVLDAIEKVSRNPDHARMLGL